MNRFLQSAIPMALGAALSPFITPMGAAAVVGGLGAFRAKKVGGQDPLMAGLTAGLGAYGGANIASELGKFGAQQTATEGLKSGIAQTTATGAPAVTGATAPVGMDMGMGGTGALGKTALSGVGSPGLAQTAATPSFTTLGGGYNAASSMAKEIAAQRAAEQAVASPFSSMGSGLQRLVTDGGPTAFMNQVGGKQLAMQAGMAAAPTIMEAMKPPAYQAPVVPKGTIYDYVYDPGTQSYSPTATGGAEETYLKPRYTLTGTRSAADGGLMALAAGGDTKPRDVSLQGYSAAPAAAANNGNPFVTPAQQTAAMARPAPTPAPGIANMAYDPTTQTYSGGAAPASGGSGKPWLANIIRNFLPPKATPQSYTYDPTNQTYMAEGGTVEAMSEGAAVHQDDNQTIPYARGGLSDLGGYSDGGHMLRGPGDGVSDSIPATIGGKRPARLADGEFVVPARAVSELGNGSTEAGARQLYAMLDRIQGARKKTTKNIAKKNNPQKLMPA